MSHWWTAKTKRNTSIISVLAGSEESAKARVTEELKKPGRDRYLAQWQADGEMVEQRPEEEATQQVDPLADDFDDTNFKYI